MSEYFVYIARCSDDSLYTGYCRDITAREARHNLGEGAKYTRSRRPVQIVYAEKFADRSAAMQREAQIKQWSRSKKEDLVRCGHSAKLAGA